MRDADDGALADARDGVDLGFDLFRIDVIATRDDEVLGAADDRHAAVGIDGGEIARDEKAVLAEVPTAAALETLDSVKGAEALNAARTGGASRRWR